MYHSVFAQMLHLMPMLKPEDCTNLNHSRFLSHSAGSDFDFSKRMSLHVRKKELNHRPSFSDTPGNGVDTAHALCQHGISH